MEQAKKVIIETFNTNSYLISKALEGMSDDDFFKQPNQHSNPIHFLLGHLTHYRYQVAKIFGHKDEYQHASLYAMGEKIGELSLYPSADELKADWLKISESLKTYLENADSEILSKETAKKHPIGDQNVMGTLQFLFFHEAYHLGQISLVRKFHGYDGIIG